MARNPAHPLGMMSFPLRPFLAASAGAYFLVQSGWRKAHELEWAQSYKAPIPVISVGNIAMGGTGKTPFVMYLVQRLVERGLKPCVISRGYRGSYATDYVVVSDGLSIVPKVDVKLVGDEPFLMATNLMNKAPLVVGKDRLKCIEFVHNNFSCDLAVLDDGFQHLKLKRDLDIVLLSGREDRMFPVGILREPISAITRADIIIMAADQEFMSKKLHDFLAFREYYTYRSHAVDLIGRDTLTKKSLTDLKDRDVLLVSAIANPHRFLSITESLGWRIINHLVYRDHHNFSSNDLTYILEKAKGATIVFTEKDWVKLTPEFQQRNDVFFLRIGLEISNSEKLIGQILEKFEVNGSKR